MADPLRPVTAPTPPGILRPLRRVGTATGASFDASLRDVSEIAEPETVASAQLGTVNPMLLHEMSVLSEEERDREAHRHGNEILDLLAELQRGLLRSGIESALASRLASVVADAPVAANPALAATLRAVVLRARIEIARHVLPKPASD